MPLPVSTESALILMSMTPVVTSVDGNVSVASHLLNLPSMATEAFTKNLMSLSSGVTAKTGTSCARLSDGNAADNTRHRRVANRMEYLPKLEQHHNSGIPYGLPGAHRLLLSEMTGYWAPENVVGRFDHKRANRKNRRQ